MGESRTPKVLETLGGMAVEAKYDPQNFTFEVPQPQDTTFYFDPPAFIMSPRIRLYRPDQIQRCWTYIKMCVPAEFKEGEQPEATLTITMEASNG